MSPVLCRLLVVLVLAASWMPGAAAAQMGLAVTGGQSTDAAAPEVPPPSPNDVREFLRLLGDESVQQWLRDSTTNAEAGGEAAPPVTLRDRITADLDRIRDRTSALGHAWSILPRVPNLLSQAWQEEFDAAARVRGVTLILIFLLVGAGVEWLYRQAVRPTLLRLEHRPQDALWPRLQAAALRAVLIFTGLGIFALGSVGTFLSFDWLPLMRALLLDFMMVVLGVRVAMTVSLFFQAPFSPELRLVPYGTRVARHLHRSVLVLTLMIAVTIWLYSLFDRIAAFEGDSTRLVIANLAQTVVLTSAVVLATWGLIWLCAWRLPGLVSDPARLPPRMVRFWRGYLTVLVGLVFLAWLFGFFGLAWAIAIIGLLIPGLPLMRAWVAHFFDQATDPFRDRHIAEYEAACEAWREETEAIEDEAARAEIEEPQMPEFADPYAVSRPIVQRVMRFVLLIGAVFSLAAAWGVDIFALSQDRSFMGRVLEVLIDSIVALLIADLLWTWARTVIDKRVADYVPPEGSEAPGPEARMITLLPLFRTTILVTLLTMVGLSVLTAMGVNIAPILAGAGILGIAIGFGTQSLVRDIVSGIFFLIDDAFRLGEYIEVGELMGTVESISIRSMRIRHHRGKVHTIPYGELTNVTNHSRDWVIMKLEFRVPFDTDLQLVKKLIKKVGAELKANEFYGDAILQTLKSQGVRRMEEFNMVVGVKFMTRPGEQWLVRRDAYQKVRDIFDANGIKLAERNVRVEIEGASPGDLTDEQRHAIAAAAQEASQGQAGPPKAIPDEP